MEAYLTLILPRLSQDSHRQSFCLMMVLSVLQYNRAMKKVLRQQDREDAERYPILSLDIDEIMNDSLSELDLQELREMLKEVTQREERRRKMVLSAECLYATAFSLLQYALEKRDTPSLEVFVYALTQAPGGHGLRD